MELSQQIEVVWKLTMERLYADGEALLKPLILSEAEIQDLVLSLKTLSGTLPRLYWFRSFKP